LCCPLASNSQSVVKHQTYLDETVRQLDCVLMGRRAWLTTTCSVLPGGPHCKIEVAVIKRWSRRWTAAMINRLSSNWSLLGPVTEYINPTTTIYISVGYRSILWTLSSLFGRVIDDSQLPHPGLANQLHWSLHIELRRVLGCFAIDCQSIELCHK